MKRQATRRIIGRTHRNVAWRVIFMLCIGLLVHAIPSQAEPTAPVDSLLVKGFSFSGNTVVFQAGLEAITQPYVGARSLCLTSKRLLRE